MNEKQSRKRLLLAGGDLRQITAAAALAQDCEVTVTGFDRFGALPEGLAAAEHLNDLPQMLDALILPMPLTQDGGFLHTPFSSRTIRLTSLLPLVRPSGMVLGGRMTLQERAAIEAAGLRAYDYAAAETFALRNAVPTAEGAIQIAMQELPVVLQGLPVLILGAGRVSRALQPRLRALGAEVTVAARRCTDLARSVGGKGKPDTKKQPAKCSAGCSVCRETHGGENKSFGRAFSKARRVKGQSPLSRSAEREIPPHFRFWEDRGMGEAPFYKKGSFPHSRWNPRSGYFFDRIKQPAKCSAGCF